MATRLLKCSLCGEVVDAPVNGGSKPACPTCGGEMVPPTRARATTAAAATAASGTPRPMPVRRPLAAPRPVTPGEAISSSSASWVPDPDPRSGYGSSGMAPPPAPAYPGSAAASSAGKDWLRSPLTYVVAGLVVVALGIMIAFLLKGGSSSTATADNATPKQRPTIVLPQASENTAAAPTASGNPTPAAASAGPEQRAAENTPPGTPINLLPMIDVNRDAIEGGWMRQPDGSISCDGTSRFNHLALPYQPSAEYDVTTTFTITGTVGDDAVMLIFTDRRHMCTWIVNSWKVGGAGFNLVDHKVGIDNATYSPNHPLARGERHSITVKVRKNYVEGYLDGHMLSHYNTSGSDLTMNPGWHLDGNQIGIGAMCPTTFHSAEVVDVNGRGKPGFVSKK